MTSHPWLLSALLCVPVYLLYAANFFNLPPHVSGTGFLQYDQPSYMADARAYFARGHFFPTYGLPFSSALDSPRIYFQPLTAVLGLLLYVSGIDPGLLYMVAGIVLAICCGRIIIAWYREVIAEVDAAAWGGLICFFWGGGVLIVAGIGDALLTHQNVAATALAFDPFSGWWMLNLGRNLVYTTEAFYHLVLLGTLLLMLHRQYLWALVGAAIMSASHPFYGIELILALGGAATSRLIFGQIDKRPLLLFIASLAILGGAHIYYYLVFLPAMSLEYRLVQQQYSLPWLIPWSSYLFSVLLVAPFALRALVSQWREHRKLTDRQQLLLVVWGVVFALAHHNVFMKPIQPIHFLHGYDWMSLFLIGAPNFVSWLREHRGRAHQIVARVLLTSMFLLDNTGWVAAQLSVHVRKGGHLGATVTASERAVFKELSSARFRGCVILSEDQNVGYLALVYTPLQSYYSHNANTPAAATRSRSLNEFFATGITPAEVSDRCTLAIIYSDRRQSSVENLVSNGYVEVSTDRNLAIYGRNLE